MEVTLGTVHTLFPMDHATRVGEARRHSADLAGRAGFDDVEAGRLAIVVTELGGNLVRHARGGVLLMAARTGSGEVEVISCDRGPGIADLARSMGDGFSTGGTPGTGLGAVRRLADDFDMYTAVPAGTIIVARLRRADAPMPDPNGFIVAGIAIPAPGEVECGDDWAVSVSEDAASVIVADGLGHGPDAAVASAEAIKVFVADASAPLQPLLQRIHQGLRGTRGAAVTLFRLDTRNDQLSSVGAGNVQGRLLSGTSDKYITAQHGTAGVAMRTPEESRLPWPQHAILVAHSDGIESRWPSALLAPVLQHDPVIAATLLYREHCRGRDDTTIVILRRKDS